MAVVANYHTTYVLYISLFVCCACIKSFKCNEFSEEMYIKPLPSGHLYVYFQFTTVVEHQPHVVVQNFDRFPKSLGELINKFNVWELHLSLTQGLWKHHVWGFPVVDAAPGAEVWTWFNQDTPDVDAAWLALNNELSGQFCASLNFVDSSNTISPKVSLRPHGVIHKNQAYNSSYVRYSSLPREVTCTENLTPWSKLLPCSVKAGLGTLLFPSYIFNVHYHSLGVNIRRICEKSATQTDCSKMFLELTQTLSLVFEIPKKSGDKRDWSLKKLFGAGLFSSCPVSTRSMVFVEIPNKEDISLNPSPSNITTKYDGSKLATYDIKGMLSGVRYFLNIAATYSKPMAYKKVESPVVFSSRFITGYGKSMGGIVCQIHNTHPTESVMVAYMEYIPWFSQVYFHTLKVRNNDHDFHPEFTHISPGNGKLKPSHLELILTLPPHSITEISFQFERAFLKWTDYPPDANHGFYIGSAIISLIPSSFQRNISLIEILQLPLLPRSETQPIFMHTEVILVSLPTPDFSMPYNVICLVCTILALAFGPLHNITTRSLVAADTNVKDQPVKNRILGYLQTVKNRFMCGTSKKKTE